MSIKRLLGYMGEYKKESILGPLFKMLEVSFELFVPLAVTSMVDVRIKNHDNAYILKMGGLLLLLALIGLVCSLTAQYFAAKTATGMATALRNDLFVHIDGLSYGGIDSVGTSTMIARMTNDINQVQNGINMTLRLLPRSPFVVFEAAVVASTVNIRSAVAFVVTVPVLCVVVFGIVLVSVSPYRSVQRQPDKVLLTTRENLMGVKVIRAFNHQRSGTEKFEEENDQLVKMQVSVGKISALLSPVTYMIINVTVVAVAWVRAQQMEGGIITQGKVIALVSYMSQALMELIKMTNLIILISKAIAYVSRVDGIFQVKTNIREKENTVNMGNTGTPKMEFKNMSFRYSKANVETLSRIFFQAMGGQTIGVISGTGTGKTTLISLIPRFYDASDGQVLTDGVDARSYSLAALRSKTDVVPRHSVLFKGTLRDNMKWGRLDASDQEIFRALDMAQAREFVEGKEQGLDLHINQEGRSLSGGQRQRLTIARALVREPEILIMDDSASALDFAADARLRKAIRKRTKDITVFIMSQRATTIKQADLILVLDNGHLAGIGSRRGLLRSYEVYGEIYLSQLSREEVERGEQ